MKIAIGADHRGFVHKEFIKNAINDIKWVDVGAFDETRSDYPIFSHAVCKKMLNGEADCGILICGTGVGMAIAANRYKKIYAAVIWNEDVARQSKSHDNVNILVIPSNFVSEKQASMLIHTWLDTEFLAGRYAERIALIDKE